MHIIEKINECIKREQTFFSFEYFPPKTPAGVENLYKRMDAMSSLEPLFCDVTWGAGGSTADNTIDICTTSQRYCGLEMMMHLTCTNMPLAELTATLEAAKAAGIQNILALRGDPPAGAPKFDGPSNSGVFNHAIDLVTFIKSTYGDYFGIAVAGHPENHPETSCWQDDIAHLKEKVEAGADFILTQMFYDPALYVTFVQRCRAVGITCPIVPGIMPIQTHAGFDRLVRFTKTVVPTEITEALEPIKDDDVAVKECGIQLITSLCRDLLKAGAPGLHFYTLNLERSVKKILQALGLTANRPTRRDYPWRRAIETKRRANESVRPIHWSNRPLSYVHRTSSWDTDEFSNGRWGDSSSPAFGEMKSHYAPFKRLTIDERKMRWGDVLISLADVHQIFVSYLTGTIDRLPWCDSALLLETDRIHDSLVAMNTFGFLTINSQPSVNAADSADPSVGWGGPGGKVYQKAYVEIFVSPSHLKLLMDHCGKTKMIKYLAVDLQGNTYSNQHKGTTAVTWGVFPNKEIQAPTVVDTDSFMVWKDEAFSLWKSLWASCYDKDSTSYALLEEIHDTYYLVSVVDHDFIHGDIWAFFEALTESSPEGAI